MDRPPVKKKEEEKKTEASKKKIEETKMDGLVKKDKPQKDSKAVREQN